MLPKLEHPIFTIKVPSTEKSIKLRPMLVKEEKILLMAKEAADVNSMILSIRQVVTNCLVNADTNVDDLTTFDLDYIFIRLRANSIDSKVKVSFTDPEDVPVKKRDKEVQKTYDFEIDLNEVTVKFPEDKKTNMVIKIGDVSGLKLRYPTVKVYESQAIIDAKSEEAANELLIASAFESYFEGDKMYNLQDVTPTELSEFIENLDIPTYNKVVEFHNSMPHVFYEIKFKNSKGTERVVTYNKLRDFFTF